MRRKALLSPLVILILIIIIGVGVAGAAIYMGGGGEVGGINLQKGLVGWWKFDGNANDSSINSNHGTVSGAVLTTDQKEQANKAYSFDGTDDNIQVSDNSALDVTDAITLAGWVKNPLAAGGGAADLEDFTTYTETDPPANYLSVAANTITVTNAPRGAGTVVYKDMGTNYFGTTFTHKFDLMVTDVSTSNGLFAWWGVTNTTTPTLGIYPSISVGSYYVSGLLRLWLRIVEDGLDQTSSYFTMTTGIRYYITVIRDTTNTRALVYSDAARTTLLTTLTVVKGSLNYRYMSLTYPFTGSGGYTSGDISNLDLQAGVVAGKGDDAYQLKITGNSGVVGTINNIDATATISADQNWHHLALTYDKANIKMYIDGKLSSSQAYTTAITTNATNLTIGNVLSGSIDDVRIYNQALSATEITALYNSYDPGVQISDLQKGLVGQWKMDGNAKDSTANSNHGANSGAVLTTDRKSQANKAYSFDGTDDYIDAGNAGNNVRTISFWLKKTDGSNKDVLDLGTPEIKITGGSITSTGLTSPKYYIDGIEKSTFSTGICGAGHTDNGDGTCTATFYPDANPETTTVDGRVWQDAGVSGTTWAALVAAGGNAYDESNTYENAPLYGGTNVDQWRYLVRGIFLFDTSSLGSSVSISAATISLYGTFGKPNTDIIDINIYSSSPVSDTSLTGGDFDSLGSTPFSTALQVSGWTTSGYNDFALNSAGIAAINSTGISKFGTRDETHDVGGVEPAWTSSAIYFRWYTAEQGAGYKPRLVVTYTPIDSNWHHVVITDTADINAGNVDIGKASTNYFNGSLDDVRIYNRALSATEVTALYQEYDPGIVVSDLQKGLVGQWKMDGNAKDSTANSNHGTDSGAVLTTDRKSQANKAYTFDGVDDYVEVSDNNIIDITDAVTIAGWIESPSAVGGGLDYEDFTTYTEVDSSSDIAITSSKVDVDTMAQSANSYVYKDYGVGYFGDFEQLFTASFTSSTAYDVYAGLWSIGNSIGTIADMYTGNSSIGVQTRYAYGTKWRTAIIDYTDDSVDYYDHDAGTYYFTVSRTGATATLKMYSDAARTVLVDTMTTPVSSTTYRYIQAAHSRGAAGADTVTYSVENLELQEGVTIGKGANAYQLRIGGTSKAIGIINSQRVNSTLIDQNWHHVALTYDKSNIKLYVDGVEKASQAYAEAINTNASSLKIGDKLAGDIDDIRVYNRALSATEIQALYESY